MARARDAWTWLRSELADDAETWQDRGVLKSIAFASVDAWLWCGSGIRLLIYLALANLYLPDGTVPDDVADIHYSVSPTVIDGLPPHVDANLRTATCLFGLAAIATLGLWPRLSFNSPASQLWVASQLWFLALDPVWGVWQYALGNESSGIDSAWRPLTAAGAGEN